MINPSCQKTYRIRILVLVLSTLIASIGCGLPVNTNPDSQVPPAAVSSEQSHNAPPVARTSTPLVPTASAIPAPPLLPAPLLYLSSQGGTSQIWRVEMNGGFAHPITSIPEGVDAYDISPADGSLAYISANNLFIAQPDGSQSQMVVAGETIGNTDIERMTKTVNNPRWSPDGRLLAFGRNGVNILEISTGAFRSLISNVIGDNDYGLNNRTYRPAFWSPDGRYLAAQVGYYEGIGLVILPTAGGQVIDPQFFMCCDYAPSSDPMSFFLASGEMAFGEPGFWQIRWDTGQTTRLSQQPAADEPMPVYAHPMLGVDNRLHFFYGKFEMPMLVNADPSNVGNINIQTQFEYIPGEVLWAPDANLMVLQGEEGEPLQVWSPGKPLQPLETSGYILKWGRRTEQDYLLAGTPPPTFTPTPTLPSLPSTSVVISPENVTQLQMLTLIDAKEKIYGLDISPDGKLLALGNENSVNLWDMAAMQRLAKFGPYGGIIPGLDFSPDSRFLAIGSWDNQVDLWDTSNLQKVQSFLGHTSSVEAVEFSPDGRLLASIGSDNTLYIWDTASGAPVRITSLAGRGEDIAFSPDGRLLAATVWNQDVNIWDVASGTQVAAIPHPDDGWVLNLEFSPDGNLLALGDWRYRITLWDVGTNTAYRELIGHLDNPTGLAFSPDGRLLASAAEDGDLRFWDPITGNLLHSITGERHAVFSPGGRLLITTGPNLEGAALWFVR